MLGNEVVWSFILARLDIPSVTSHRRAKVLYTRMPWLMEIGTRVDVGRLGELSDFFGTNGCLPRWKI